MRRTSFSALVSLLALATFSALGAQQAPNPKYERQVVPGAAGANRLPLDATLLAGARPFRVDRVNSSTGLTAVAQGGAGDLRLYDASGTEVPYLLVMPQVEARWREGRVLRVAPTRETSGFEVDLEALLPIDRMRLEGLPAPFLKRVRLEGSGDRTRWTLLAPDATLFDLPADGLEQTSLDFASGTYRYLRLTWDDRATARMPRPRVVAARIASPTEGPAPLRAPVRVERRASEPGKSRFRLRLPGAHLPIVALELDVSAERVMRAARVSEGRLAGGQVMPAELGRATLRRAVRGGVSASALQIPIAPPSEAELELEVDDGNNPPLGITSVTAVFATLPFVYFESAARAPLTARYGDDRLAEPQYDLEAVRDRVASTTMAEARWGETRPAVATAAPADEQLPTAGGAIDASRFRFSRSIPAGQPGLATLQLDAAALAHGTLSDLRIATPDGRQVPFLLERLDAPLTLALPLERAPDARDGVAKSRYRVRLPYEGLPESRLVLRTDARVFDRRVTLEVEPSAASDARPRGVGREGRRAVASVKWVNTDPSTPAPALTLDVPALASAELTLLVDEGDNAPLPIRDASLLLPNYRLRFVRDGRTTLSLLYGQSNLAAPRYDLALVARRLLGAPAEDVVPTPEGTPVSVTGITPTIVFWVALGVAVAALLALMVRLLKSGSEQDAAATAATPPTPSASPPAAASGE